MKNQKNKLQQITWESDSLTRVLGGSWNLLELTWQLDEVIADMVDDLARLLTWHDG